jgi:hypothetical protein
VSYEAVVYFASPRTRWSMKVQEEDVILRRSVPWLWLARRIARGVHAQLDASKCGYVVLKDGDEVEHVEPTTLEARTSAFAKR